MIYLLLEDYLYYRIFIEDVLVDFLHEATFFGNKEESEDYNNRILMEKFPNTKQIDVKEGDTFDFTISKDDAYGEYEDGRVIELDKSIFVVDGKFDDEYIKEGNIVPMMDAEGNRMNGIVLKISKDKVKMDFNHPLAGEDLNFRGKVIEVRDATEEEIAVATKPHKCGHCGGNCGNCDSECGGDCDGGCDGDEGCGKGHCNK